MDVTTRMLTYREAARGLWNNFLRHEVHGVVDFEAVSRFRGICDSLFDELVVGPIGLEAEDRPSRGEPYEVLLVRPKAADAPARVRRPSSDGNRYWDDPITRLRAKGLRMKFVEFYDFDDHGFIDLQFFLVRIEVCEEHPHLAGREALIEVRHGVVEFERS